MSTPSLRSLLDFALDAAWQAGRITLGYFQTGVMVERKADNTPVTIADRQAEQKLRDLIARYWPEHGIIGEEFGTQGAVSGLSWILDPIDGTKSFVHGVPLYATLIALADGTGPLIGVAHFPALGETVYAARGEGCYWNGRRAHVSQVDDLADAALLSSEMNNFAAAGRAAAWQRLVDATYIQRTWGDAYGYALVATGRAEIMVDPEMEVWDCGPLQVILEEAGGTFTDWKGTPTIYGGEAIATNGLLFDQVMELVRGS
ncbi:MAG: histidinol-phosphatase [Anaerolineae bacterium]|nr:histidinol-phosphatase [Anaerolineae bacterium]